MNIHKNARLTPLRREEMAAAVLGGRLSRTQAASVYGVSPKIVSRWTDRFRGIGTGSDDGSLFASSQQPKANGGRPCRPDRQSSPTATDRQAYCHGDGCFSCHRQPRSQAGEAFAHEGHRSARSHHSLRICRASAAWIHLDIKRLGRFERIGHRITGDRTGQSNSRGVGWEYVHVCIDDASRIAFTGIFPDEKAVSAIAFSRPPLLTTKASVSRSRG